MSKKEAIDKICEFVSLNYSVFNLQKYDEDLREDILVYLLEKGNNIIDTYTKSRGCFLNYLFCCISNAVHLELKKRYTTNIKNYFLISESTQNIKDKELEYGNINYDYFEKPVTPYSSDEEIAVKELKKILENIHGDKKLLIIAIKSAFYITDHQIEMICNYYKIDKNDFLKIIQYCKESLQKKYERRMLLQERRNKAYFYKKKYEKQLELLEENDYYKSDNYIKRRYENKLEIHYRRLKNINEKIQGGKLILRPTSKTISSITGLCERRVSYIISQSQKYFEKKFKL